MFVSYVISYRIMERRCCVNNPNSFCYICGSFIVKKQRRNITSFVTKAYKAYFGIHLGDQSRPWAPHTVCSVCVEDLRNWIKRKKQSLHFGIPMVWREPQNHSTDCYFCTCNVKGFNAKNKKGIIYPNLPSAMRPVAHGPGIPIPKPPTDTIELISDTGSNSDSSSSLVSDEFVPETSNAPQPLSQAKLNDIVRDLNLPKDAAELLGSRLQENNLLAAGTSVTFYRNREKDLLQYFSDEENLVYCNNIPDLINKLGSVKYDPNDWRLFIDSSKRSLKGVLLHCGNVLSSVPVAHSVRLKESYESLKFVLEKIKYDEHQWLFCGDLKVICMILGQQQGFTKYPCYMCEWDSRAREKHWKQKQWPKRESLTPGSTNIIRDSLVNPKKIILPPLHIKLGIMKQFVKALDQDGDCFKYLSHKFPALSEAKIKEGIFVGPQIRALTTDREFEANMTSKEKNAWNAFKEVMDNFLGNNKHPDYVKIVNNMLRELRTLGCNMSLKLHFLFSHLDVFPDNLGALSEEQGERFHQDIREMERRYQGRWNTSMMADYCWMLCRESTEKHKRKSKRQTFETKRTRFY